MYTTPLVCVVRLWVVMKIVKYKTSGSSNHVGVLADNYSKSFSHIKKLCDILIQDYPYIKTDNIHVNVLGGPRFKNMICVEANVDKIKDDYISYPEEWLVTV